MVSAVAVLNARAVDERRAREKLDDEFGPVVRPLLMCGDVLEVMLNPDGSLWVDRLGEPMRRVGEMDAFRAQSLIGTIAAAHGRVVNRGSPEIGCEIPWYGFRFQAEVPPVASAPTFNIRRPASRVIPLEEYVAKGLLTPAQREAIRLAVRGPKPKNILVSGGTSSGKTTFGNAVLHEISVEAPHDRVVILEDTRELQCSSPNVVALRTTPEIGMLALLKMAMRKRPDRIVVGEVRDREAHTFIKALNTGHEGGFATVHANSPREALDRIESLVAEDTSAPRQHLIAQAIDIVVHVERAADGRRRVSEIAAVEPWDGSNYVLRRLE